MLDFKSRLLSKVNVQEDGCWTFTGHIDIKGYGHIQYKGENIRAHRASWLVHYGDIPKGLHVLHKCDCPTCINPEHLYLGTNQDNVNDRVSRERSAPQDGEANGNAYLTKDKVQQIRKMLWEGHTQVRVSELYRVSLSTINQIKRGIIWGHV